MTDTADRARIERDLAELLAIPSVTGDEYAVQGAVARLLTEAGVSVERLDVPLAEVENEPRFPSIEVDRTSLPIVVGSIEGARAGPTLMLQGHVDVVPPGDPAAWTSPAFAPDVRDGAMYGRGACDMKGGVIAAIEAMRMIVDDDLAGRAVFVAVPAEEDGGAGAFAAIRAGLTADACVISEPTDLDIAVAQGGAITFTLDVPGKAAHASMRREGVSALDNLTYLVEALREDEAARNAAESHPLMRVLGLPYPTIIGQVDGGNWASTVMDRVVAHGRYGVTLGQDAAGAVADLQKAIEGAAGRHEFLADHPPSVTVWGGRFDSAHVPTDHPLPLGLQDAAARLGHSVPGLIGDPSGSDMRLYINEGDTPTVMYGPGAMEQAHAADEYVPLADVAECAEVLAGWLRAGLTAGGPVR
jgi:acetylornithine deacetylase